MASVRLLMLFASYFVSHWQLVLPLILNMCRKLCTRIVPVWFFSYGTKSGSEGVLDYTFYYFICADVSMPFSRISFVHMSAISRAKFCYCIKYLFSFDTALSDYFCFLPFCTTKSALLSKRGWIA